MTHKNSCATPVTDNNRTQPAAGPSGRSGKTPCAADRGPRREKTVRHTQ